MTKRLRPLYCFHRFHYFERIWKPTVFTILKESGSPFVSLISDWLPYKTVRK